MKTPLKITSTIFLIVGILAAASVSAQPNLLQSYYVNEVEGGHAPPPYMLRLDGFFNGDPDIEVTFGADGIFFDVFDDNTARLHGIVTIVEYNDTNAPMSDNVGPGPYAGYSYYLDVNFDKLAISDPGSIASYDPSYDYYIINPDGIEMTRVGDPTDFVDLWTYPLDGFKPFQVGDGANLVNQNFGAYGKLSYEHTFGGNTISSVDSYLHASGLSMDLEAVPEPTTMALFGLGLLGTGIARRFRKRQDIPQ